MGTILNLKPTVTLKNKNFYKMQGRESKGRLITPYRSAAFLRDVINLIPRVQCPVIGPHIKRKT